MHEELANIGSWLLESPVDDERRYQFMKKNTVNQTILDFGCGAGGFLDFEKNLQVKL